MKKRILSIVLAVMLCIAIVACSAPAAPTTPSTSGGASTPTAASVKKGEFVAKYAGFHAESYPTSVAAEEVLKKQLEEKSQGRVEVQVFHAAQLGGERDVMEQMQLGTVQLAAVSPVISALEPKISVLDLPFLFKDATHIDKVITGKIGEEILKDLPSKGLRCLGYVENGFRVLSNNKRPVNSLSDLQGLKIRVPEAPVSIAIFDALGANPTPIAFNELYGALQQGVVDGQENGYNTITLNKLNEVQKYVAETNHMWSANALLVSEKWWKTLPADIQNLIKEVGAEFCTTQRKLYRDMTEQSKQTAIASGVTVTTPELDEFREATRPVYEDFYKQVPEAEAIVEQILALK
jgi:tripartite ATP-independent transporter DctP family solute receptor